MKTQVVFTNYKFDNQYRNAMYFSTRKEQIDYFNLSSLFQNAIDVNFNPGTQIITQLTYRDNSTNFITSVGYNYCIVKVLTSTGPVINAKYYYYFITAIKHNAANQVTADLELDVIQTFLLDVSFSPCLIKRAHLDRWSKFTYDNTSYLYFNVNENSLLFAPEEISADKRLIHREKIKWEYCEKKTILDKRNDWINENVNGYVYIFAKAKTDYKAINFISGAEVSVTSVTNSVKYSPGIDTRMFLFFYPLYNNDSIIQTHGIYYTYKEDGTINETKDAYIQINDDGYNKFEKVTENSSSYYFAIKVSIIPPFRWNKIHDDISISDNKLTINTYETNGASMGTDNFITFCQSKNETANDGIGLLDPIGSMALNDTLESLDYTPSENIPYVVKIDDVINKERNINYCPKLWSSNFRSFKVTMEGESFEYDYLKAMKIPEETDNYYVRFKYIEMLNPDVSKCYLQLIPQGLYSKANEDALIGIVLSTDNSMFFTNDKLSEYLAQNKNYWLQTGFKIGGSFTSGMSKMSLSLSQGKAVTAVGQGVGAVVGLAGDLVNSFGDLDNLQASPDSLQNAKGNVIFNVKTNTLYPYVEEYAALNCDLQKAYDYFYLYGYAVNIIDVVRNYFNIRYIFNYVQADLEEIYGNSYSINNEVRHKFRDIFKEGVRFWNDTKYLLDYTMENYERSLINE